jgi:hypothetical protein
MAARRRTRARETQLAFEALSIEGGLLSPDWLSRAAQLAAGGQGEADYRVPKGLNLRDEIGRYWRIAQAHWGDFAAGRAGKADTRLVAERFVLALLRDGFGFATLAKSEPIVLAERSYPIGFAALGGRVPVIIAPAGGGLDTLTAAFGDGTRRRSAFGLAQEYLNAADGAMWGLASDGLTLRIVRDNASLTRPAWIEADLQRMFTEERYADFAALWLLAHETRFGRTDQPVAECALETWRNAGREEGTRAREHLRRGVEDALVALGQGFLVHPDNQTLRAALQSGTLSTKDYFNQLLRLVYRLIFLLTVEERGVLHPDGAGERAKSLYSVGYSLRRLRERSVKRSGHDRFADLWEAAKVVFRGAAGGEPRLGLPALAGIFASTQCPALDGARLENRALLLAVFKLSWLREDAGLARVNWRDMGPEELGSVYESLLELVPQITKDGRHFAFATGGETKGNARKTTGSYYTPDSLVQVLLESALEPVIKDTIASHPANPVEALLGLSIVDPACGSGHFLLAGARRLAAHVARIQANGTPAAAEYRHALRQVVGRCIFGVDLNPMAVELCKVSLWMEAVEPGLPLTFLDAHIQQGNALLGTTPDLLAKGIPDAAWDPIEGDDKKIASALKKQNKQESKELSLDFSRPPASTFARLGAGARAVDEEDDSTLPSLEAKAKHWAELVASVAFERQQFLADTWCAAFVWRKEAGALRDAAPTNGVFRALQQDATRVSPVLRDEVERLRAQYAWFHWVLRFPQVFANGGFDVVLGNPPWEKVKLQEQEFFASRSEEIANAVNASARKKLIAKLPDENSQLWADWCAASRRAEGESHVMRQSGRYPLCGKGDVNTYAVFAEHNRSALGTRGRAGFIVPTGLATDDTTKEYFSELVSKRELSRFYSFENEEFIFPGVHHAFKFALLALSRSGDEKAADLVFFARATGALAESERHFSLSPADFKTLNPNTRTCPTFRSRRDAEINLRIYRAAGILLRDDEEKGDPWNFRIHSRLWHMAEDADAFRTADALLAESWQQQGNRFVRRREVMIPLLEAKMLHQFDHRFGTYAGQSDAQANQGKLPELDDGQHADPQLFTLPHYWVDDQEADRRLAPFSPRAWLLGWRKIARSTDQRTMIPVLFPKAAAGDATPLAFPSASASLLAALYANLCSFALDYCARQKVGGTNVTFNYVKQLPVLDPARYGERCRWCAEGSYVDWLLPRVLELAYTAWDLEPLARDVGHNGTPFRWSAERRFQLRCELDAAFFHLYALARDDVDYVMDSFPVVRKNDEKARGEYRTKRVVLEVYDALAKAAQTGRPFRTPLDPLPGAPGASHGTFAPDGTPRDYAEALRMGLLFTLIRHSSETGISESAAARALLWLRDSKHAASWLEGTALADFERVRESDALLADGTADSQATKLLEALENEKAIMRDAKGIVRLRAAGLIPSWLPQTPTLTKLASVMLEALERAEQGVSITPSVEKVPVGKAKRG